MTADLIVATDTAEFALPEVRLGFIPDSGGVLRLPEGSRGRSRWNS